MILVDDREGSRPLAKPLAAAGIPTELTRLDAGDLYFVGRGVNGVPLSIGIEHKTVADCVTSLRNNRLQGHQLIGMRGTEEPGDAPLFDFSWLIVQGEVTYDRNGKLTRRTGRQTFRPLGGGMTVAELFKRLTVLHLCGGLNYVFTANQADTIQWVSAFYRTWTDVDLDKHKSHLALYTPPTITPLSQFRRIVGMLPGVGPRVSLAAEKRFGTVLAAMTATPDEWAALTTVDDKGHTRVVGKPTAERIVTAIRSRA